MKTKKELLSECQRILYGSSLGRPLNEADTNFLLSLFPLHPRWSSKLAEGKGNIKSIIVRTNQMYRNRNFALVFDSNEIVDISFTECVNRSFKEDIRSACSEVIKDIVRPGVDLNYTVSEWIKGFDKGYLTIALYLVDNGNGKHFENPALIDNFRNFYGQIK